MEEDWGRGDCGCEATMEEDWGRGDSGCEATVEEERGGVREPTAMEETVSGGGESAVLEETGGRVPTSGRSCPKQLHSPGVSPLWV